MNKAKLCMGLARLKAWEGPIEALVAARNEGDFQRFIRFMRSCRFEKINRRTFESLIMSGAFDKLGPHRAALSKNLEDALRASDQHAKDKQWGKRICSVC